MVGLRISIHLDGAFVKRLLECRFEGRDFQQRVIADRAGERARGHRECAFFAAQMPEVSNVTVAFDVPFAVRAVGIGANVGWIRLGKVNHGHFLSLA
jgi:hypothetical protein